jgi:hypothetical protein
VVWLSVNQWNSYRKPVVQKDTFVQVDIHKGSEFIDLDIDMIVPNCPCPCKLSGWFLC